MKVTPSTLFTPPSLLILSISLSLSFSFSHVALCIMHYGIMHSHVIHYSFPVVFLHIYLSSALDPLLLKLQSTTFLPFLCSLEFFSIYIIKGFGVSFFSHFLTFSSLFFNVSLSVSTIPKIIVDLILLKAFHLACFSCI